MKSRRRTPPILTALLLASPLSAAKATPKPVAPHVAAAKPVDLLYREIGLEGILTLDAFRASIASAEQHGITPRMVMIADLRQPSTAQRLYVIDLEAKRLMLRTWVAHGQGSGDLTADRFSNRDGSHASSLGLYRVGSEIQSPKHGPALLLEGLDRGINDKARAREIIIHSADYVSQNFIDGHGRLGRSWGCPAVPREVIGQLIDLLADGGLLYVYGG